MTDTTEMTTEEAEAKAERKEHLYTFNKILEGEYSLSNIDYKVDYIWKNLTPEEQQKLTDYIMQHPRIDAYYLLSFVAQHLRKKCDKLELMIKRKKSPLKGCNVVRYLLQYHREQKPSVLWLDGFKTVIDYSFLNSEYFAEYINNIRLIEVDAEGTEASLKKLSSYLIDYILTHSTQGDRYGTNDLPKKLLLADKDFFNLLNEAIIKNSKTEETPKYNLSHSHIQQFLTWKFLTPSSAYALLVDYDKQQRSNTPCSNVLESYLNLTKIVKTQAYYSSDKCENADLICYAYLKGENSPKDLKYDWNFCSMLFLMYKDLEVGDLRSMLLLLVQKDKSIYSHQASLLTMIAYFEIEVIKEGFTELRELLLKQQRGFVKTYDYDFFKAYVEQSAYYGWQEGAKIMYTTYKELEAQENKGHKVYR